MAPQAEAEDEEDFLRPDEVALKRERETAVLRQRQATAEAAAAEAAAAEAAAAEAAAAADAAAAGASSSGAEGSGKSEYEQLRDRNIARNRIVLAGLGL